MRTSIQTLIDKLKIREQQLIEAIIQEEQHRLKQLNVLQHDTHIASTFISSFVSQSERLKQKIDDEILMMKHQDKEMKEMVQQIEQEFYTLKKMNLPNQPLLVIGNLGDIMEQIERIGRVNRSVSLKMMKAMKVKNEVWKMWYGMIL